jgi:hypothetical protein
MIIVRKEAIFYMIIVLVPLDYEVTVTTTKKSASCFQDLLVSRIV